jgi:hypothetical protein
VHRIKTVLVVLAIMLITLTSLQGIVKAAQVQRIHKNQRFVYIDGGTKDGFVMGSTVCIFSFSGKKIACGKVHKTSESKTMVGIDKAMAIQIKNGMEARLVTD